MPGFIQAVALDLDGTLTVGGKVPAVATDAIDYCRSEGTVVVLVTGRIRAELAAEFPTLVDHVDAVVYENGAVLDIRGDTRLLASVVETTLVDALRSRGVALRSGEAIVACDGSDIDTVLGEVARQGLDYQVLHNRAALMVLPAGVSKGNGLRTALDEFGVSVHNTVAIGDAENDLSMLEVAEVGVAVANAIESVRVHADLVLPAQENAVASFLRGPVVSGSQRVSPSRHACRIGAAGDGTVVSVPGGQASILVCGASGTGKSHLAGLLAERWIAAGYTVLVVDPEGDHESLGRLRQTIVVDASAPPSIEQLLQMLRQQPLSVVLDLSSLGAEQSNAYLATVAEGVEAIRSTYGVPHWIVVDEAHNPVGTHGSITSFFRPTSGGYCYVTYHPDALCRPARATVDLTITLLGGTEAVCSPLAGQDVRFRVDPRLTPHVRHRRKYLCVPLDPDDWFVFRSRGGAILATASTIEEFANRLGTVSADSIHHHAANGDFSRWAVGALQDRELAALIGGAESDFNALVATGAKRFRGRVLADLRRRYEDEASPAPQM